MPYTVDFNTVSTVGLESSPVAAALAGLRANEARYFKNKYDHVFTVEPASDAKETIDWVHRILKEERDIVIASRPLEATAFQVENIRMAYVFYESGLSINVMYTIDDRREAGRRLQALRRDGRPRRAIAVQVREAEVEAGRNDSRLLLRDQERVLTPKGGLSGLEPLAVSPPGLEGGDAPRLSSTGGSASSPSPNSGPGGLDRRPRYAKARSPN